MIVRAIEKKTGVRLFEAFDNIQRIGIVDSCQRTVE